MSNFSYRKGGITANIFYGDPANIAQTPVIKEEIQSIFIIGGLLSIGIYNLLIFAFTKKQLDLLYTSLASFALAIRTVILNKYLVIYLFPDLSWILLKKAEYIIELVIFLFIVLMIRHLYQQEIQGTMVKVTYIYVFVCIVYFILAPPLLITKTAMFHIPIIALILGYFLFYVTIMAFLNKREGAKITFIGLILLLFGIVHDTLLSIGWIDTFPIVDSCILIYFILKGVVISYRFSALFQQNNALNMKLVNINEQLEETIASRTKELQEKNKELEEANKKLSILSTTDGLTGLANRRQLDHLLETEIAKAASCQYPLAVMVIDVDYFKKFNDTYGHLHGDDCLKLVSEVLKNHSNDQDILSARYGGEEFVVIVRNKTEDLVHFLAEQIRRSVENLQEKHIGSPHKIVTISIGVAIGIPAADTSSEQFLEAADHALYQVKEQGRNGVILLPIQKVAQKTLS